MAQRRMFSLKIVDSDAFLDMPASSQLLYFHLSMRGDDDGFVGNPKKITKMIGANDDDLKILLAKRFILSFESGVVVIKHWKIHNYIQNDRYNETQYIEEKKTLITKDNGSYTECIQNVSTLETQVRLGKDRIGKDREELAETSSAEVVKIIDSFKEVNPSYQKWFKNKTQRQAVKNLIDIHGLEQVLKVVGLLNKTNKIAYMPSINTPLQLEEKWEALKNAFERKKDEIISKGRGLAI